jgi:LPS export ABC transporter protein LptC
MRSPAQRQRQLRERLVAVAATIAGLALLYGLLGGREDSDVQIGEAGAQRGYYITDATMTETGPTGKARVVVRARTIEQALSDDSVQLADLALDYHTKDFGSWHVTALAGHMPPDRKSIELTGDVTITGAEERGKALIRTDRLSYDIDGGIVQTADPVAVRFGPHVLNARGLHAELNAGTLRLESDVNGRFAP